jgi:ABC-2 type transport system permease protein
MEDDMLREMKFLVALWKANLLATMEFRVSFLTQVIGMMLNNGVYFLFWVIFFDRFDEIRGWGLNEMFVLFGLVACGIGLGAYLFGNALRLSEVIANGELDYYLSLPRPVLLHTLASRGHGSNLGDFIYGILSFLLAGNISFGSLARFVLGSALAAVIFLSFMVIVQSLAFWFGNAQMIGGHAMNAIITFSIYPINLFEGSARFLLFTLIPAAFVGAIPAKMVTQFTWVTLGQLLIGASVFFTLAWLLFYNGLKRYESGSAILNQS